MGNDLFKDIIRTILLNDLKIQNDFEITPNKNRGQSITYIIKNSYNEEKWIIKFFDYLKGIKEYFDNHHIIEYNSLNELMDDIEVLGDFPYNIEDVINLIETQKRCFDRYVKVGEIGSLSCFPKLIFSKEIKTDDSFYGVLIEEYVCGQTLEERLKDKISDKVDFVYKFLLQMAENLSELLPYGIIHRDLSPDNIMLLQESYILIDPGVVKIEDGSSTKSHMMLGKKFYVSPEQYMGNAKLVTFRSDLYSVGVIALEVLLGYNPLYVIFNQGHSYSPHKVLLARYDREIEDDIYSKIEESNFISRILLIIKKLIQVEDRNRFDSIESFIDSLKVIEREVEKNE